MRGFSDAVDSDPVGEAYVGMREFSDDGHRYCVFRDREELSQLKPIASP